MTLSAFDTHSLIKRLTEAGMPEPQAEIIAAAQKELLDERLATKHDIELIHKDIEQLRLEFKADMAELKTAMFRWSAVLTGVTIGTIGLIMTLVH